MAWDLVMNAWRRVAERLTSFWRWGLSSDDVKSVASKRRELIEQLQARCGALKNEPEKLVDGLMVKLSDAKNEFKHLKIDEIS
jgi:hypothetical protein